MRDIEELVFHGGACQGTGMYSVQGFVETVKLFFFSFARLSEEGKEGKITVASRDGLWGRGFASAPQVPSLPQRAPDVTQVIGRIAPISSSHGEAASRLELPPHVG